MSDIKNAILTIAKAPNHFGIVCKVISIDVEALTIDCEPLSGNSDILGVRLQTEASNGLVCIPAIDSFVIVHMINEYTGYVAMFSQLDSIQFLDGSHGGLVKVSELVDKLNTIESDLNALKTAFSDWVVVASDGGAALKTITATWYGSQLTETEIADIENDKITHGNN